LVKYSRDNNIRKDPSDQSLIEALLDNDWYYSGISSVEFKQVVDLYKGLAEDLQIAKYKDLVSLIQCRFLQNIQEHEIINTYSCRRLRPLDPAGSCRKKAGKSPDPAGKHRK
jgi:hypothetical protein